MKRSNEIMKKIKNLIVLSMIIMVLVGIYFNIRNSKAEQENEITLLISNSEKISEIQEVKVIAIEGENDTYSVELPRTVKNKIVNKYVTENEEELILRKNNTIDKETKNGGEVH